ncbi:uncharacterized protein LOC141848823 [Brevipalpus obovatus]|uniref:uncharacterized protein LOC141848823 n=1 Tax=Brevipalpus obovatus TaxID=246614 RepID=UPI003D9DDB32
MDFENLLQVLKVSEIPSNPRLVSTSYRLHKLFPELNKICPKLDYPGVPYNGLRSLVKILHRLVSIVIAKVEARDDLQKITDVLDLFTRLTETMVAQAVVQLRENSEKIPEEQKFDIFLKNVACWWQFAKHNRALLTSYFGDHMLFYLDPTLSSFIVGCTHSMAALRSPVDAVGCAVNSSYRGHLISEYLINGSLYYPLKVWALLDNPLFNGISSMQASKFNVLTKTIHVPRQKQWIIPADGRPVQNQHQQSKPLGLPLMDDKPVRCRLLRSKMYPPNGKLIIHISGGGFVMFKPEINEGCYLQYWAGNLSGTTLLSLDYTKLVVYPRAFQEALDVYLWATSGQDDAIAGLGFKPEDVVLCGDSAGSHLAFSICRALQDIRQECKLQNSNDISNAGNDGLHGDANFIFPSAFVSFYSNMTVAQNQCSLGLTCLEAALTPSVLLSLYGLIASGLVMDEDEEIDGLAAYSNPNPMRDNWRTWFSHGKNWFNCEPEELIRRFDTIRRNTSKAYLRPMTDEDLSQLADLRLFVICGEFDFFLDGCINLAKAWKGPIKLDIVENVNHGFLSYSKISRECRQGSRLGLRRLREALNI